MSARVLNPVMLSEFCRMRSPARSQMPSRTALAKVKRDLFGPVDRDDSQRFVEKELTKHHVAACDRWGFNFVHGYPLADHKQYIWERVPPTTTIPQMYTLSRAAHVRITSAAAVAAASRTSSLESTYTELLDERAEKSNRAAVASATADVCVDRLVAPIESSEAVIAAAATTTATPSSPMQLRLRGTSNGNRQPKITDYLKERKRLLPTPKKVSPTKRTRSNYPTAASSVNRTL